MTETDGFRRAAIIAEIHAERDRQDQQWGGPAHDDTHDPEEWLDYMAHQVSRARADVRKANSEPNDPTFDIRQRLIKIAALAIAGIESIDREAQPHD